MPKKIAIVDDEHSIRKALRRLLVGEELEVLCFESGESFLESARTQDFDGVVLDIHMPGLGGLGLLETLRKDGMNIPVILITAHDEEHIWEKVDKFGVACLRKPFKAEVLIDHVRRHIIERVQ